MKTIKFHLGRGGAGTAAGAVLLGVYEGLALLFPGVSQAVLILAAAALIGVVSAAGHTAAQAALPAITKWSARRIAAQMTAGVAGRVPAGSAQGPPPPAPAAPSSPQQAPQSEVYR